jgi:hypothetical protein
MNKNLLIYMHNFKKLKTKHDAKKKKVAQKAALKRTKSALAQAKKKYK